MSNGQSAKQWKKDKKGISKSFLSCLGIPDELCSNYPYLSVVGNQKVYVENFHDILNFTDSELVFMTKGFRVSILGSGLSIRHYTNYSLILEGRIHEIRYE